MDDKKKFWIKLEKDFLNSSQIKVIKHMPNGKDYIIFYLALMLESTNSEGHLRFSELVPYNEEMLASITDTNVDIVRSAMVIFQQLGMIQILGNGTIFLPDVPKRVGKESDSAERVRLYREREKSKLLQCNADVTKCNDNIEEEKSKEENIKEESKEEKDADAPLSTCKRFVKPTLEEIKEYCLERKNNVDAETFYNFYEAKGWKIGKEPMKSWKACIVTWEKRTAQVSSQVKDKNKMKLVDGSKYDRSE